MKRTIISTGRRAAALALALLLSVPSVFASAAGSEKLSTRRILADGLTYTNTISQHPVTGRTESYALALAPDSRVEPILLQSSGTVYAGATINKAVQQAQNRGYQVLGAINTDYFSPSTGVPMGIAVEDGVFRSGSEGRPAILIRDGKLSFTEDTGVDITLENHRTGERISVPHFNKWRTATGGMYLLNRDFSSVSTRTDQSQGWMVRMELSGHSRGEALTLDSSLTLEVTQLLETDQAVPIGEDEYILTSAKNPAFDTVFSNFQVGDRITLTTSAQDTQLAQAQWAGGCGDVMIRDGAMTDPSVWIHAKEGRAPRTAVGMLADGTLLCYVADGRHKSHSGGLTQKELAQELLDQGCVWAVNLDGGGSTTMSVMVPGLSAPAIVNRPSDGKARSCATYLLLVSEDRGNGRPSRLALKEDGLVVLTGSSVTPGEAVCLDSALNPLAESIPDLVLRSETGLGSFDEHGVYTAGATPGTDTIRLSSSRLGVEGTAQIHVVDSLSQFSILNAQTGKPLTQLTLKVGESLPLSATGTYWSHTALRDVGGIRWTVTGGVGEVSPEGVFTASFAGGTGSVTADAGSLTATIPVTLRPIHTDVTQEHWAHKAVDYCYDKGIVGGVTTTQYGPDLPIRRADFMLMLYGALGRPTVTGSCTFTDVNPSDYYYTALAWGQANGLASGVGEGIYSPGSHVTREQAFTILRQAMPLLGIQCEDGDLSVLDTFSDRDRISSWAAGHTATLVAQGIVSGKGSGIDPTGKLSRAEMAALLYKLIHYEAPPTPIQPVEPEKPVEPPKPVDPPKPVEPEKPVEPTKPEQPQLPDGFSLTLSHRDVTLRSGESFLLKVQQSPQGTQLPVTWSSSDPSAVVVAADGTVTNIFPGVGNPTATVTAAVGGVSESCLVRCQAARLTGTVTGAELGLNVRSAPGTDSTVIGSLKEGVRVVVLQAGQDGWHQILFVHDGQAAVGYVSAGYLHLNP